MVVFDIQSVLIFTNFLDAVSGLSVYIHPSSMLSVLATITTASVGYLFGLLAFFDDLVDPIAAANGAQ